MEPKIKNKILCVIQARMGSTRLPGKVLKKIKGLTLLEYQLQRVSLAKKIDKIIVASTTNKQDDKIELLCEKNGTDCFRGSEEDVLDRYYQCSLAHPEYNDVVRISGDSPLIDPRIIDELIALFIKNNYDYANNVKAGEETFPDGMDCEIFTKEILTKAWREAKLPSEKEHVTPYIRKDETLKKGYLSGEKNYSSYRLTVDNPEDFEVIKFLIENTMPNTPFLDYIKLLDEHPEIRQKNTRIARNEGLTKSLKNDYETQKKQ